MRFSQRRKDALEELSGFLSESHNYVDVIIVEGMRDVSSLKALGCEAEIEVLSHTGVSDHDLAMELASKYASILILTDFDEEGLRLNQKFCSILERTGAKVETGLRRWVARLMARIGVYAIESLDNVRDMVE